MQVISAAKWKCILNETGGKPKYFKHKNRTGGRGGPLVPYLIYIVPIKNGVILKEKFSLTEWPVDSSMYFNNARTKC